MWYCCQLVISKNLNLPALQADTPDAINFHRFLDRPQCLTRRTSPCAKLRLLHCDLEITGSSGGTAGLQVT